MNRRRHRPCPPEMFCPACAKRCPKSTVLVHLRLPLPLSDRRRSRTPRGSQSGSATTSHWVLEPVPCAKRNRWLKQPQPPCQLESYRIGVVSDLSWIRTYVDLDFPPKNQDPIRAWHRETSNYFAIVYSRTSKPYCHQS